MFKFSLTTATFVFLLMSGAADLCAMDSPDDLDSKPGKQLVIAMTEDAEPGLINHMPSDVMKVIIEKASKDNNPRHLTSVCKFWYNIIRENQNPDGGLHDLTMSRLDLIRNRLYPAMNPFMKKCMNTYWENRYYNGILRYTPTDGRQGVTLKFSDFRDGTFDLSTCEDTGKYLVITESMDRFFKVEEENKNKTVILITPRYLVEQRTKTLPTHPFATHMVGWDADKAPVGIFWRWGNDKNLTLVNYLTTKSIANISSCNLFENSQKSDGTGVRAVSETEEWYIISDAMRRWRMFDVNF